jgi:Zn finger protein HypA/HybF involved in hydrogenase expression
MRRPNTNCNDCNQPLYRRPSEIKKWKNIYCDECKKNHMNEFAKIKNNLSYQNYIEKWKNGEVNGMKGEYQISRHIIRYLYEKYNNKCSKCGWNEINQYTRKIPLEVEHIDGNYKNNKEENLTLLCPNCHSLTPTYKGANRGNGRKERKKYA